MNNVVRYLASVTVRMRWRRYVGVALLLGLTGGLSLFSIAGGRRTQSAYPRFLRSVNAQTMSVTSSGVYDPKVNAAIAAFPEVVQSRTYVGLDAYTFRHGAPDLSQDYESSGTFDGLYVDQDRFTATSGRPADQTKVREVVVNEYAAEHLGYHVGDRVEVGTFSQDQIDLPNFVSKPPAPRLRMRATVVGIGLLPEEVLQDDEDRTARLLFTEAYSKAARSYVTYSVQGLVLRHGDADIDVVKRRVAPLAPPGTVEFRVTSVNAFHARQALRPLAIALVLFGVVIGVAGVVLVAQALSRVVRIDRGDRETLRALGVTPRTMVGATLIGPAVAIIAGTALAVLFAIVASPAMPIGPVRRVEVSSGFDIDFAVVGLGAVVVVAALIAFVAAVAWFECPHRLLRQRHARGRAPIVVTAASAAGMAPPAMAGLTFAFEPSDSTTGAPTRSVIAGTAIALVALVGSLTFGASLDTLVHRPQLYGWNWDVAVLGGNGYDNILAAPARKILGDDPNVAAWSGAHFGFETIDGAEVPLLGMAPGSAVLPPILEGRPAQTPTEIVLGAATADRLHKSIGDQVTLAGNGTPHRVTIVGIATLPTIGRIHVAHTSLGVGALVAPALLPGIDRNILGEQATNLGPNVIFVRFRPGVDADAELAHLRRTTVPLTGFAGLHVLPVQRPAEIVNSSSIGSAPVVLALALLLGAMLSLGLALAASVRRRGRDLIVLRTLGFTRRQLGATVRWQATTTVGIGLLAGVPVGVLIGRALWDQFARQLDVVSQPRVPVLALLGIVVGALVVGNVVAAVPARAARRVAVSRALQAE
jgi:hypothetical protein